MESEDEIRQEIMDFLHSVHDDGGFFEDVLNLIEIDKLNINISLYFIDTQAGFNFYNVFRMMDFSSNDDAKRWIIKAFLLLYEKNDFKTINNIFQKIKFMLEIEKELIEIYKSLDTCYLIPIKLKDRMKELKMIWNDIIPEISTKG